MALQLLRRPVLIEVEEAAHEALHIEVAIARAERLRHATDTRTRVRAVLRRLSQGQLAGVASMLVEVEHLLEAEALRAMSMDSPCACGIAGPGHGDADDELMTVAA
jgi:hypothetical protein